MDVDTQFEQYLLDEAWRAGLRKPDDVFDFVDYWRTTSIAKRVRAGMELKAALLDLCEWVARPVLRALSRSA